MTLSALFRVPDLGHLIFALLWLAGATWAHVQRRPTLRKCFACLASGWSGMYLGGMGGGLLAASREDWGKSLAALLALGILGALAGLLVGRKIADRALPYFLAQALFAGIVVFLLPLF